VGSSPIHATNKGFHRLMERHSPPKRITWVQPPLELLDKKNKIMEKIIDIVKDNVAKFDYACGNNIYYKIIGKEKTYLFPIDMSENGTTPFTSEYKAVTLMRWIRKSIKDESLISYPNKKEVV
jgi:hypothetical protein